jgi:hypothetical protein
LGVQEFHSKQSIINLELERRSNELGKQCNDLTDAIIEVNKGSMNRSGSSQALLDNLVDSYKEVLNIIDQNKKYAAAIEILQNDLKIVKTENKVLWDKIAQTRRSI